MFDDFAPDVNLTRIEEQIRRFWQLHRTARQLHEKHAASPRYGFHQPPLGITEPPGISRTQLLCTSDLFARYHTLRGRRSQVHLGWNCHGLGVEARVTQSAAQNTPRTDVEQIVDSCRGLALRTIEQDQALAHRLGIRLDPELVYASLAPTSVSHVWGVLRQMWDRGLLRSELRVVDTCSRCATPLSAGEAGRLVSRVESHSLWVHLPWEGEPDTYFLIWTPSSWMLLDMVALALHPDIRYALVELPGNEGHRPVRYVLAESALDSALPSGYRLLKRLGARSLRNARYRPAFTFVPSGMDINRVVISDSIEIGKGTGLRPVTPTFDASSLTVAQAHDLPVPPLIDRRCRLDDAITPWRGLTPLEAEPQITRDLDSRGLVYSKSSGLREQGLCPYCESSLLPALHLVWLIETASEVWILGRDNAWGVPLPIWMCTDCNKQVCAGGLEDLAYRAGLDASAIEPHRPHVDQVILTCEQCRGPMRRITPVVDASFESAVLALDSMRQPYQVRSSGSQSPTTIVISLQTWHEGWLQRTTELSSLLGEAQPWDEAMALAEAASPGFEQDSVQSPPGDAIRWAIFTGTTPQEAERDLLRPLWKAASELHEESANQTETDPHQLGTGSVLLDQWLLARVEQTTRTVTEALDRHDWSKATTALGELVSDYCGWYRTLCRDGRVDVMSSLLRLLAPFVPHLAEAIHLRIDRGTIESIHLAHWPTVPPPWEEPEVLGKVALVRQLEELGQEARRLAGVNADRLLPLALVGQACADATPTQALALYSDLLRDVLAVSRVEFRSDLTAVASWQLALNIEKVKGRALAVDEIDLCLKALTPQETAELAGQLLSGRSVSLAAAHTVVTLLPDEVLISLSTQPGWTASAAKGCFVLLRIG